MGKLRYAILAGSLMVASMAWADTAAELKPLYDKVNAAMKAKNVKAVMGMCTADFTWTDTNGKSVNRKQMEEQLKAQMQFLKTVDKVTLKIGNVTAKGKEFTAHTEGIFEATIALPDGKKTSKLKNISITEDTWVKVGPKWMLKRVKSLKDKTTVDGKPFAGG